MKDSENNDVRAQKEEFEKHLLVKELLHQKSKKSINLVSPAPHPSIRRLSQAQPLHYRPPQGKNTTETSRTVRGLG